MGDEMTMIRALSLAACAVLIIAFFGYLYVSAGDRSASSRPSLIWNPKPDITAYELSQCAPVFYYANAYGKGVVMAMYETLPNDCKRHFDKVEK